MVKIKFLFFFQIITFYVFASENSLEPVLITDSIFTAKIIRDQWGVPHIYGKRDADASFGLAYAHSEDDFETIQDVIYALRGDLSMLHSSRDAAVNDYYVHAMNFWGMIEERYENEIPEDVKILCEGYAAGINKFLQDNPSKKRKGFEDVVAEDVIVGFSHRMPFMFGLDGVLKKLSKKSPPEIIGFEDEGQEGPFDMLGSNFMAIAPRRSSDGYTRLWINTHQPWDGPVAWYEAHLVSEEGWDFYGALFPGSPVPLIGHNPYLGWSHTVNSPDLIDVYKLTINDKNKDQYWFEGYWKDMDLRLAHIKVKILGLIPWKFKRVVKKSIHGPVIEFDHGSYAIRISSLRDLRFLEQWYRMGKAQNFFEFKEAMKLHAIPMFNTGYADRDGNIYYVYNAKIPKRDPRYNWKKILPGESKRTLWYDYVPFDQLPQVFNPFEGFFQNCNSSPYLATGSKVDVTKALPDWTGIETHQTNRALRSLETFGVDPSITREEFFQYKFDVMYSRESILANVRERYLKEIIEKGIPEDIEEAVHLIKNWDLSADSLNTNAVLAILSLPNAFRMDDLKYNRDSVTNKIRENIKFLESNFGRIDVPMGRVFRLIRGDTDLPLSGGPGTLRAMYYKKSGEKYKAIAGDCYIQAVEWSPDKKVNAWSIHQYGSATKNKTSAHYDDQSKMFSKHKMKSIRP